MSDTFWNGLFALIATVVLAYMTQRTKAAVDAKGKEASDAARGAAETAVAAADQVRKVKSTLQSVTDETHDKLDSIAEVGEMTHTLVNSNFGNVLHVNMLALQRVAQLTGNADDLKAAQAAVLAYQDHLAKQAAVDNRSAS